MRPEEVTSPPADDNFLSAKQTRARYGNASAMWLHRRLHGDSDFPPPDLIVSGRRFWRLASLRRWEKKQALASEPDRAMKRRRQSTDTEDEAPRRPQQSANRKSMKHINRTHPARA